MTLDPSIRPIVIHRSEIETAVLALLSDEDAHPLVEGHTQKDIGIALRNAIERVVRSTLEDIVSCALGTTLFAIYFDDSLAHLCVVDGCTAEAAPLAAGLCAHHRAIEDRRLRDEAITNDYYAEMDSDAPPY